MTLQPKTTHHIGFSTYTVNDRAVLAAVFGELVKLVVPHLVAYHSDLFHDALILNDAGELAAANDQSTIEFTFGCSDSHTDMTTTGRDLTLHNERVWLCNLHQDDKSSWVLDVITLKEPAMANPHDTGEIRPYEHP